MRNNFAPRGSYLLGILFTVLFTYILTPSLPEIVHAQSTTNPGNPTTTSILTTTTVTTSVPITTSAPVTTTLPITTTVPTTTSTIPSHEIPTLSEWGMIIFMTIILGIGVVAILKRRTEER